MGQSLIDFAKSYGNPDKGRQSLSDYARALNDADPTQSRTSAKIKATVDLSKPYGNAADWDGLDPKTAEKVIALQKAWGEPLQLNSTFRSKAKNKAVRGATKSQHLHGKAVDISVRGMSKQERSRLLSLASAMGFGGLGVYTNAIHVDTAHRRSWGLSPTGKYSSAYVPGWAKDVISTHAANGFKGRASEFASGTLPGADTAEGGGREVAMDMPLPERKGTATATGGSKIARGTGKTGTVATPTKPGSTITSPVDGTVVAFHPDFRSYRGTAIIKGADGTYTVVSGLQAGTVKSGDKVRAGDPIGVAGNDVAVSQKGPDGNWSKDPSGLLAGVQSQGTEVAQSSDGYGMGSAGMESESPAMGIMGGGLGGPTGGLNAPAGPDADLSMGPSSSPALGSGPLSGDLGMGSPGYADAGLRGQPSPASQIARALQSPSMDSSLMGGAPAPATTPTDINDALDVSLVSEQDLKDAYPGWAGFDAAPAAEATPAFDRSYSSQDLGGLPGYSNEGTPDMPRYGHELGPISTAFGTAPNISTAGLNAVNSADSYGFTAPAAPAMAAMTADFSSDLDAPSYGANFGALKGMGSPPSLMGLVSPIGDISMDDSYGFSPGQPSFGSEMSLASPTSAPNVSSTLGKLPGPSWAGASAAPTFGGTEFGPVTSADSFGFSPTSPAIDSAMSLASPGMSISDVSPAAASALGGESQFAGIGAPDGMAYGGTGSFGGIGAPTADQAEAQRGMPSLSMAGLSGTPANSIVGPTQKADAYAPGLRDFKNSFEASVKSVGPKYSKAIAAALATPSIANQVAAVEAAKSYSNMNGQPSKAVQGLRSQQIGDFAMANPALGSALGLSMGQQGQQGLGGGIGSDPFGGGGGFGGPSGPSGGSGGGFGGPGGQPSGPSFGGPTGPSAGRGGGYGSGTSGGQPSGPSISGPTGPGAGPGYSGGGNPGSTGKSGNTGKTGPGAGPGQTGAPGNPGMSHAAAAAIGAALSGQADAAAAAAASDAARGFGGYGGFGPSFSGGFF